jgi:hypothetical protein
MAVKRHLYGPKDAMKAHAGHILVGTEAKVKA